MKNQLEIIAASDLPKIVAHPTIKLDSLDIRIQRINGQLIESEKLDKRQIETYRGENLAEDERLKELLEGAGYNVMEWHNPERGKGFFIWW